MSSIAVLSAANGTRSPQIEASDPVYPTRTPEEPFQIVDSFDVDVGQKRIEHVLREVSDASARRDLEALRTEHATLRAELAQASDRVAELLRNTREIEDAHFSDLVLKNEMEQARDEMQEALRAEQAKTAALKAALESKRGAVAEDLTDIGRDALQAVMAGSPTPAQCLCALEMIYGDRVVVLQSAHDSASEAADFRYGDELWRLLKLLATDYRAAMINEGGGDGVAKRVFGSKFAAKESEVTMNNGRAKKERSFSYDGEDYVMWRHLKHGVADTTVESIRVHFEWLGDQGLILIGHCGAHLYLPSF